MGEHLEYKQAEHEAVSNPPDLGDGGEGGDLGRKAHYIGKSGMEISTLANGSAAEMPDINISEEVNKSGVWKSLEANTNSNSSSTSRADQHLKDKRKKSRQMSIVDEDADESNEDTGITIKVTEVS